MLGIGIGIGTGIRIVMQLHAFAGVLRVQRSDQRVRTVNVQADDPQEDRVFEMLAVCHSRGVAHAP